MCFPEIAIISGERRREGEDWQREGAQGQVRGLPRLRGPRPEALQGAQEVDR